MFDDHGRGRGFIRYGLRQGVDRLASDNDQP
jgi:hypothetical protein